MSACADKTYRCYILSFTRQALVSSQVAAVAMLRIDALGQSMKAIHTTPLPAALAERVPQEAYSPHWRKRVKAFHKQVEQERYDDPIAASLAAFWLTKRGEIERIVERAEQLAVVLQKRAITLAVCHSDLHAGNVLVGADDELTIVDWDEPILAPKERDLMFIGGGVGGIWNNDQETRWFYQGYGQIEIDLVALSYYRYERIVVDIAERAEHWLGAAHHQERRRAADLHAEDPRLEPERDDGVQSADEPRRPGRRHPALAEPAVPPQGQHPALSVIAARG